MDAVAIDLVVSAEVRQGGTVVRLALETAPCLTFGTGGSVNMTPDGALLLMAALADALLIEGGDGMQEVFRVTVSDDAPEGFESDDD